MTLWKKPFYKIVEKGENAGNQHFLLFPQCFLPSQKQIPIFQSHFILLSANAFKLGQSWILLFGKEFNIKSLLCLEKKVMETEG